MAQKKITTIPATMRKHTVSPINCPEKRKVAGYARVSTNLEEQLTSYEAQVDYYTNYIKSHDNWEFAGMYTDEGVSATSVKKREGFKKMVADAKAGKIDLIITKSVSRFARNTVDSLTTIRELREKGIEIFFEKENLWTLDPKVEMLIAIISSLSQEESRSISENVTWGQRKRFADGKVSFAYSSVLGFEKGPDGQIVVNREEAEIVKLIFRLFLEGMTPHTIAAELTRRGIKSPGGKDVWCQQTVRRMLSNEKYKGDALLQKQVTVDYLSKKMVKNEGQAPQYYVENNHEAIISPQVFDLVQAELEKRKRTKGTRYSGVSIFSNRIKCGDCGSWYGSKVWHSNDKYRRVVYRCNHKYGGEKCQTPHVTEDEIKDMFITAFNQLLTEHKEIISNIEIIKSTLFDVSELIEERNRLQAEMTRLMELAKSCAASQAISVKAGFQETYNGLIDEYAAAKEKYDEVHQKIESIKIQNERMNQFLQTLKSQDELIKEFDETLWCSMVEFITVGRTEKVVTFKDGTEIRVN
ncbi:MAG: recombinase family protein [Acutalibacteraceae bacterium]|nr:recombinase family protein [Acutalibacteraceae bacterium]